MNDNDIRKFTTMWNAAAEVHGKKPSDAAVTMAFRTLVSYDLTDIRRALDMHLRDPDAGRFMVKPADIVSKIDGDPETRSLSAWTKVDWAIRCIGPYRSVTFDDVQTMATIDDMGGWIALCKVKTEELPFKRNEFVKRYKGHSMRPPASYPKQLIGLEEASSEKPIQPFLIGDQESALLIYQSAPGKVIGATSVAEIMKSTKLLSND